jgi:predicted RNA binding protein YcfA (HicA-like mRNA interferase family)
MLRVALKLGWRLTRHSGSHAMLVHADHPERLLVIPRHRRPLAKGTLSDIMSVLELDEERLRGLL